MFKILKKWNIFFVGMLMLMFLSCGEKKVGKSSDASSEGEKVLQVWLPSGQKEENDEYQKLVNEFNDANKGKIKVEVEFVPRGTTFAYEDRISSSALSNELADIIKVDGPNISNYADSGILLDLTPYFTKDDLSDFVESTVIQGTYKDKLYALAETESTVAVYFNKKIFEKAGITPPTELEKAWTFQEFYEIAKKLTTSEHYGLNISREAGSGEWLTYMGTPFIWSNKGDVISDDGLKAEGYINSPAVVEVMEWFSKMAKEKIYNISPTPTEFEEGKAAMKIIGSWESNTLAQNHPNFKYGITFLPYNKVKISPSGDWSWGVTSQSKNPKEASEFIKFITSSESSRRMSEAIRKPPARKSAFEKLTSWNEYPQNILKQQVMNTANPRPRTVAYPVITQEFAKAFDDIILGSNPKESLDKAGKAIDDTIARQYGKTK